MSLRFPLVLVALIGLMGCPSPAPEDADDATQDMPNTVDNNSSTPDMDVTPDMDGKPDMGGKTDMDSMCQDTPVYTDADGDGAGSTEGAMMACLLPDEAPGAGLTRTAGDCDDMDPLRFDGAPGVCGDAVDDSCDGKDESCPASKPASMNIPDWDCTGTPPSNVYAHAAFDEAGSKFTGGSCLYFFEGESKVFFVKRVGFASADGCQGNQCFCPGGYDQRLYAFTRQGGEEACADIVISKSGPGQPVSNACRKYLYQMNLDGDFSFVATGVDNLERRLSAFPRAEIACVRDTTLSSTAFPFSTLLETDIVKNDGYTPL